MGNSMIEVLKRPYLVNWSGNNIYYELYSAEAAADNAITFEVAIMFARSIDIDDFEEVIVLPFVPVAGTALFDIKDIIDAQLSFDMPEFDEDSRICENQSGYFYIEFREITPDNPTPSFVATEFDTLRVAVKGGVHPYHYKGNNFWLTYNPAQKNFFTWKPQGQLVLPTEQTWLAFFYEGDEEEVLAEMELTYRDGITETFTRTIPVLTNNMILLQSSLYFDWDGGAGYDADNVYRWKVRIRDAADTETLVNWYMYELDNRQDYNETMIHYRSSFGGLDNVRVRGVIEKKLSYELQQAEHILPVDYFNETTLAPQQSTTASSENVLLEGEIGFVTKAEQESLRDIFLYRLLFIKKQNRWWPLLLLTDGFTLKRSTDMRWSVPLQWKVALTAINHYTEEETDFGEGVNTSNVCLATLIPSVGELDAGFVPATVAIDENPQGFTITEWEWRLYDTDWEQVDIMGIANIPMPDGADLFIYFRLIAPDGSRGPVYAYFWNDGITIPAPTFGNSQIICRYVTDITIKREGVDIFFGVGNGSATPLEFDCADGTGIDIQIVFGSIRPRRGSIVSGSNVYAYDDAPTRVMNFNNIDASGGIDIIIF
jgi:hypothetical protein